MYRMKNSRANSEVRRISQSGDNAYHAYALEIHYENKATMLEYYEDIEKVFEAIKKYHETELDFKMLAISRNIFYI